jgi:hypothetical protein
MRLESAPPAGALVDTSGGRVGNNLRQKRILTGGGYAGCNPAGPPTGLTAPQGAVVLCPAHTPHPVAPQTPSSGLTRVAADDRLARHGGDYERFVEAITYQDGRIYADARGPKDLYSEDVESMGLFGAVISKMEVRKMQRRMRTSHRTRASQGKPPGGTRPFGWLDGHFVEGDARQPSAVQVAHRQQGTGPRRGWEPRCGPVGAHPDA